MLHRRPNLQDVKDPSIVQSEVINFGVGYLKPYIIVYLGYVQIGTSLIMVLI